MCIQGGSSKTYLAFLFLWFLEIPMFIPLLPLIPFLSNTSHEDIKDVIKPYDWTFSTDYKGSHVGVVDGQVWSFKS